MGMVLNLVSKLRTGIARNIIVVASGTAGAQLINLIYLPFITKIYGPVNYGILGTFIAFSSFFAPIAALSYPTAIILGETTNISRKIATLSRYVSVVTALFVTMVFLALHQHIVDAVNVNDVDKYLYLIPVFIVFSSWFDSEQQQLFRNHYFRFSSKVAIFQSIVVNSLKVSAGLYYSSASILIILTVASFGLHAFMLNVGTRRIYKKSEKKFSYKFYDLWLLAKEYRDFPLFRTPQSLLNVCSISLPALVLAAYFGPTAVGFYTLAKTVVTAPVTLISNSVGNVLYPKMAEKKRKNENIASITIKATIAMGSLSFIPFALLFSFSESIFEFFFGDKWLIAGHYASWISVWLYFGLINRPSMVAAQVLLLQKQLLIYELLSIIGRFASIFAGILLYNDDNIAIMFFSIAGAVANLLIIIFIVACSKDHQTNIAKGLD